MDSAEQLRILTEYVDRMPPRPRPRHPESGCPCTDCTARDNWLEDQAEARRDAREGR